MASLLDRVREAVAPGFTVERELGRGGMAVVFLGHDPALDRPVAIKILKPEQATARAAERFLREARILAKVRHPNIVPIYQPGENKGISFYVMEYVEGETVAARIREGPLAPPDVIRLGADLLGGLEAAHRLGIVHRDVKPSNAFLLPDRAVLADFGIAQPSLNGEETLTGSNEIVGTLRYMAPEQLISGSRVDQRADLYSLGVLLYEACTGDLPRLPAGGAPVRWSAVPRRLRRVLQRALEPRPEDRWPDAASFGRALLQPKPLDGRLASTAAGIVAAIGLVVWLSGSRAPAPSLVPADLAVLPFESTDRGRTGRELARYTADLLQWFPRWSFQPTSQTFGWADTVPEAERQDRAWRDLKAGHFVAGTLIGAPGGTLLELTVRDSTGRALNLSPMRVAGSSEDLPAWSRVVADSIVARTFPGLVAEFRELSRRSADPRAYQEYFRGENAFQRDAYEEAERYYVRALGQDPEFVEAALRLAIVRRFRRVPFEADLKRLYEQSGSELPEQHRQLIEALLEPDLVARFARYRRTVAAFPRDATVRFVYADELFHRAPLVGIPLDTALAELTRLLDLHPGLEQASTYDHRIWGYLRLGRKPDADSSLEARMDIPFTGELEEARKRRFLQLAYDSRFRPRIAGLKLTWLSLAADSGTMEGVRRFMRLGNAFDIPEAQLALGKILAQRGSTLFARASGRRAQGLALMLMGRPGEALPHLDTALTLFAPADSAVERAEWRVLPPLLGMPADSAGRAWGAARLEALARDPAHTARAAWALAVASAETGSGPDIRWSDLVAGEATHHRSAARLSRLLDGMAAAARGRPDSALALTEPLLAYDSTGQVEDPFARAVLHTRRAGWLLAQGDTTAADRELLWFQNSDSGIEGWLQRELEPGEVDAMLSAVMRLRRARLALARGDPSTACPWLRRVAELWEDAEPSYGPLRGQARALAGGCES